MDLSALCRRAASIDELLAAPSLADTEIDVDLARKRFAAWRAAAAAGDANLFLRRLARDGWTEEQVLRRFGLREEQLDFDAAWTHDATWIVSALRDVSTLSFRDRVLIESSPLPFEDLFLGVVEQSHTRLRAILESNHAVGFSDAAVSDVCRILLARLCGVADRTIFEYFDALRTNRQTTYREFLIHMRSSGLDTLLEQKPVLLRLLATTTSQWIEATSEMIRRYSADASSIAETLGTPRVAIVQGVSIEGDLHNRGRAVHRLTFNEQASVLYKPRSLELDLEWARLVNQLNRSTSPIDLRVPKVLPRVGYGWVEYIHSNECLNLAEVERFYLRAGAWLCLFHLFCASDMHEENVIAAGEYPIPVDLETLLQPEDHDPSVVPEPRRAFSFASATILNSVLYTGFLPNYTRTHDNATIAHGGLIEGAAGASQRHWTSINSDCMAPSAMKVHSRPSKNLPRIEGVPAAVTENVSALTTGFSAYAHFLSENRSKLLGAIERFRGISVRKLLRHTRYYAMLLDRLSHPKYLHDGVIWSANLDFTARLMDWDGPGDPWWPLLGAERQALCELNVPLFSVVTDGSALTDERGASAQTIGAPGLERSLRKIEAFDDDDIEWQCEVIRISTSTVKPVLVRPAPMSCAPAQPSENTFQREATEIRDHLTSRAILSGNSAAWLGLDWMRDSAVCQLAPMGGDLYNGTSGLAVFFALHAEAMADTASALLAHKAVSAIRPEIHSVNAARWARALGIGGAVGVGSIVYTLVVLGQSLKDNAYIDDALSASRLISPNMIAADRSFDVMDGGAGALLCLIKLYNATGDSDVIDRVRLCVQHLLAKAPPPGRLGMTGMSHGAAGLALALSSAAQHSPNLSDVLSRVCEYVYAENEFYSHRRCNWPDLRYGAPKDDAFWPSQWCHGAAGIGLARIATLRALEGIEAPGVSSFLDVLRGDVERAVATVKAAWPYTTDTLCCGTLGTIEFLSDAASLLSEPELAALATNRLVEVVEESRVRGDYVWDISDKRFNIGLYRGLSGVGYSLVRQLRLSTPNILVWQ